MNGAGWYGVRRSLRRTGGAVVKRLSAENEKSAGLVGDGVGADDVRPSVSCRESFRLVADRQPAPVGVGREQRSSRPVRSGRRPRSSTALADAGLGGRCASRRRWSCRRLPGASDETAYCQACGAVPKRASSRSAAETRARSASAPLPGRRASSPVGRAKRTTPAAGRVGLLKARDEERLRRRAPGTSGRARPTRPRRRSAATSRGSGWPAPASRAARRPPVRRRRRRSRSPGHRLAQHAGPSTCGRPPGSPTR